MDETCTWHRDGCHQSTVLEMLERFRTGGHLCDVTLKIGDHCVKAHRVVLAASSPYFQAMFMGNMLESQQSTVIIKDIDSNALDAIVTYAYTAQIKLHQDNAESILACANLLQITSVYNACCLYLASHLNAANCLGIWRLASFYASHDLEQQSFRFARDHFQEVSGEAEFQLLTWKDLEKLVACEDLAVSCEEQVFKAIVEWAKLKPSKRSSKVWTLLKYVAIPLLSSEFLLDQVESEPILSQEGAVATQLRKLQTVSEGDSPVRIRGHRKKIKILVAVGGECEGCSLNSCYVLCEGSDKWSRTLPTVKIQSPGVKTPDHGSLPVVSMHTERSAFGMACDGRTIYVAGGLSTSSDCINTLESYNVEDNTWGPLTTMRENRHGCQACLLNNKLYIIGGHNGRAYSATVERFTPETTTCDYISPLPHPKAFAGSTVMAGRIYIIGGTGCNGTNIYHSSVHYYEHVSDCWNTVAPLQERRAYVGATVLNGCIYVIGGFNGKWLKTVEKYDPRVNQWIYVAPMKHERSSFGISVSDGCIYVAGGFDGKRCLSTVIKYNPLTDSWSNAISMPSSRYGTALASLEL